MMGARRGWLARVGSTVRAICGRGHLERELDEEIGFHLESRAADLVRSGMLLADARRQARIEFGGSATHKSDIRAALGLRWWDELRSDLGYGLRALRRSLGFTTVAVGSLALAIGANTTAFSVANLLLYQRLHLPDPGQLRLLLMEDGGHSPYHMFMNADNSNNQTDVLSYPVFEQLRDARTDGHSVVGFTSFGGVSTRIGAEAIKLRTELVSGSFYSEMELRPVLGRSIQPSDDRIGAPFVAVISFETWQRHFAGSPAVLGRQIVLVGVPVTIIGVNPRSYTGAGGVLFGPDITLPLDMMRLLQPTIGKDDPFHSTGVCWLHIIARVPPGEPGRSWIAALQTRFTAAVRGTVPVSPGETVPTLVVADGSRGLPFFKELIGNSARFLQGFVALVLLLACANVANLMLARAVVRQREMAVRLALGATRSRVLRQVLTESLLLAILGGVLGLLLGYPFRNALARGFLPGFLNASWEPGPAIPFRWPVFAFTASVTLLTAVLFGLLPAWRSTRTEVNTVIKEGTPSATRRRKLWSGKGIVAVQLALSTVLVIGAAVFTRTLLHVLRIDLGFLPKDLLLFQVSTPVDRYPADKFLLLQTKLNGELARVPGVQGTSLTSVTLLAGDMSNTDHLKIEGAPATPQGGQPRPNIFLSDVGPDFLHVMGIPLLRGRDISAHDTSTSPHVAIVNQLFAETYFPHEDPVGHRISVDEDDKDAPIWLEIVGVSGNTVYDRVEDRRRTILWTAFLQSKEVGSINYIVRSQEPIDRLAPALRRTVQSVDPDLPVTDMRTQEQQIASSLQQQRTFAALTATFGLLALTLACVGVYGVVAYTVSQRTSEIGIRLALGAQREQVRRMILREAVWLTTIGVASGVFGALMLSRGVRALLYDVQPRDPLSFAGAAMLLFIVALCSAAIPAARASRTEPMEALRHE